jgi:hypothetical protein
MPSKRDVMRRNYWLAALVALVALATAAHFGPAEAQMPTTARIRLTGAIDQQRDAYGYFHFQGPDLLVLWVIAQQSPQGIVSVQMRHRGASFIQPGRYPVVRAGHEGPQSPSVFQVFVQHEGGLWPMDSGSVTIERADTLSLSGHVSVRGPSNHEGRASRDTIRAEAQFTLRYDPMSVQLRQLIYERADPHPPSSGQRPAPRAAPSRAVRPLPPAPPQPEHLIEGSMGADGSCVARLDGQRATSDTSRQSYMRDFVENAPVAQGQDWQFLPCGDLTLSFLAPVKNVAAPGRYTLVDREFPTVGTFTAMYKARVPLDGDPLAPTNLMGRAGVLEIEAADSARIIGRFRVTVQARWP